MEITKEDWEGVKAKSEQLLHEGKIGMEVNKTILDLAIKKIKEFE